MIAHLISSELKRKLLTHYFTHPEEQYYVRELSLLLDLDPGNLSKELRKLTAEGFFEVQPKGKEKFYRLNVKHPLYHELKQIIFKTEGVEGSLRELVGLFREIEAAFIYGSYARGAEKAGSDIDLIVVGAPDRKRFTAEVRKLEDRLGREINFNLYASGEFKAKRKEKGGFLNQVTKGRKILLKGLPA